MRLSVFCQRVVVVKVLALPVSPLGNDFVERGHRDIDMPLVDQFRHESIEQGQQKRGNMRPVYVGIRHDDDLVVPELRDVEVIAVAFRKAAAEGVDHGLDLGVCQDLIDAGLLHIEDLASNREDGLVHAVSRHLGAAAGRIALHDEDLAFVRLSAGAVGQLSVGIEGKLLPDQQIGLGLFFRLPYLRRFFGAADHGLEDFEVPVKIVNDLISRHLAHCLGRVLVVQLGLGLSLEPGIRVLDGDDRRHSVSDIGSREIGVLFLECSQLPGVVIDDLGKNGLKAGQMRAALRIVDVVAESEHIFVELIDKLERPFDGDLVAHSLEVDDVRQRLLGLIERANKPDDPVRFVKDQLFRRLFSLVRKFDRELRVEIGRLMHPALDIFFPEPCLLEDLRVRQEIDPGPGPLGLAHDR